ncbi:MAG: gamma carbonic anhydrase family protein [Firmicutes bacterium]|nr:gamma carbonic anhydrase family protein [Bacillota bacterium]
MIYPFEGNWPVIDETAFVAPGALIIGKVEIGPYSSIWYNTVVRGDVDYVRIGSCTNIQDGSVLHGDVGIPLIIGDRVTAGHMVILHSCVVEDEAFIGMGATVLGQAKIGAGAVVGARSLVLEGQEIPPGVLALGSPARVVRALTEEERLRFRAAADRYMKLARLHTGSLKEMRDQ